MSVTFKVEVLGNLEAELQGVIDQIRNELGTALMDAAQYAKVSWLDRAQMKGVRSPQYNEGIENATVELTSMVAQGNVIVGSVSITNESKDAYRIEEGHEAFHLPSKIQWPTPKTKTAKDGTRYIDVPFRHTAAAEEQQQVDKGYRRVSKAMMMPDDVYRYAKTLARTIRMNQGAQYDARGNYRAADKYRVEGSEQDAFVASRLSAAYQMLRTNSSGLVTGRVGARSLHVPNLAAKYQGMMKTHSEGHTEYMTIRRLTEKSTGWNIPALEGKHIAADVARMLPDELPDVISAALVLE